MWQTKIVNWGDFVFQPPFLNISVILIGLCFVGCGSAQQAVPAEQLQNLPTSTAVVIPTASPTATATQTIPIENTPTAIPTHTPTSTFTPTATPSPTTEPLIISGDPVAFTQRDPEPTNRTSCGEVDTFDFPMDPPNGALFTQSGQDFGRFRERYDKFHAGEDWGQRGGVTLGAPVHSIGNGRITYAQPLGWGADKGVVIIEHIFNDGRKVLSFYGHLDEESFEVFAGECVARGQQLALVGNPKTRPHLHFEIRTHAPDQTLGGYWGVDPRLAGWIWPSRRIWDERIRASSGVVWVRPFEFTRVLSLGQLPSGRLAILDNKKLWSLDPETGTQRQFLSALEEPTHAVVSAGKLFVTQNNDVGLIYRFREDNLLSPTSIGEFPVQPANSQLIARPGGGIVVAFGQTLVGINEIGEELWQVETGGRFNSHVKNEASIFLTTNGDPGAVWEITATHPPKKIADLGNRIALSGENLWVYATTGIYKVKINNDERAIEEVKLLPTADLRRGDLTPLPGGGLLIAHVGGDDNRLFGFAADGEMTWERSYRELPRGSQRLTTLNGQPYLISEGGERSAGEITVYEIEMQNNRLNRLFLGDTRFSNRVDSWIMPVNDSQLLINIGGGSMQIFDPTKALLEMAEAAEKNGN